MAFSEGYIGFFVLLSGQSNGEGQVGRDIAIDVATRSAHWDDVGTMSLTSSPYCFGDRHAELWDSLRPGDPKLINLTRLLGHDPE